jgi:hypothetical protein
MPTINKAVQVLDELLGLCPGKPGVPEKIWKAVYLRLKETNGVVILVFNRAYDDETTGRASVTYFARQNSELWESQLWAEVKLDCAALDRLGFDSLDQHIS